MDTITKQTKRAAIVTLIVGLFIGLGIGGWSLNNLQASTAPEQSPSTSKGSTEWDPVRQMEQMQPEIDSVIRRATEEFEASPKATFLQRAVNLDAR